MTTLLAGSYAFLAEHWLIVVAGGGLVGGWLLICRELCAAAEPERDANEPGFEPPRRQRRASGGRSRPILSWRAHRQSRHRIRTLRLAPGARNSQ